METEFKELLGSWSDHVRLITWKCPILLLSTHGLDAGNKERLKSELLNTLQSHESTSNTLSVILSTEMNHIYFRLGTKVYDYRPHRGPFSRLAVSDYRVGKTDRSEILLSLTPFEREQFLIYVSNIEKNRAQVLGEGHPLSLVEPDFTVRAFETQGSLNNNRLLDSTIRHNCLTWLSTAPIGKNGESLLALLGMSPEDISHEAHSYIVRFYQYLLKMTQTDRIPALLLWTQHPLNAVSSKIQASDDYLTHFYSPESQTKATLTKRDTL